MVAWLASPMDTTSSDSSVPSTATSGLKHELLDRSQQAHIVQFYDAESQLVEAVTEYLLAGLAAGEPLLLIATAEHRDLLRSSLAAHGVEVDALVGTGRLTMLDARETLSQILRDDAPDPSLFDEIIGGVLQRVTAAFDSVPVRAYGEMVDLLWRAGNPGAALRLENLWNELSRRRSFSLFCAYVMGSFYRVDDPGAIEAICAAHSHVLREETSMETLRDHARALQRQVEERMRLEAALREALHERSGAQSQLEALHRIGKALHSELDLEKIVQRVTDEATAICGAEFGAFFYNVIDPVGESYTLYTLAGVPRERFSKFPMPRNTDVFGPTFRGEGVVRLDDVTKDARYGKNAPHHGMPEGHLPVCSYLAVPVVALSGEVLGGLFFGHSKPGVFRQRDEDSVVAIAAHAAIAIENARLYDEQRNARKVAEKARAAAEHSRDRSERLQRLTGELSRAIGAEDAARVVIHEMRDLAGVDAGGVMLFDETGTKIERFFIEGDPEGAQRAKATLTIDSRAPICDAARTGELVWVVGADEIQRRYPHLVEQRMMVDAKTWGGLPITFEGRTLGAIGFRGSHERDLTDEERGLLLALGRQCGQAMERARLHDATLAARADAERANRAKDDFLAMLGHELRNPLSPILSAIQLMRIRGESGSVREQDIIERQVKHLIHLVDDLLDISRITRGKVELDRRPQKVSTLVAKAVEIATPLMQEREHELSVSLPPDDVWLDIDEVRMAQVLTNLLSNAAKYTDRGGRIELRVERAAAGIVVRVRDNGAGIAPELLPRVFDLFVQGYQTSERSQGGLGVGLALVRTLVEMHGGTVHAASAGLGRGSELTVSLPVLETKRTRLATSDGLRSLRDRLTVSPRRILVVDDNVDAASLLCDLLRSVGHDVQMAHDGPAALELQPVFEPEIAILDIGLPGMDGYDLATTLRERAGATIALIAVTGYGQEQDRLRAERAGFGSHFVKPVALARLLAEIELQNLE